MRIVGTGTRILNFIVDTLVVFAIAYAVYKIRQWYVFYYGAKFINFGYVFFAVLFAYYFLLESFSGRTVGKLLSYSKVVTTQGKKVGIVKIFIRSLIRLTIVDMFFIPFLDKPLHDYVSKTEVVEI
ncbi:MAG: RDD family protein [Bacteroidetes bacterium]|nr:RDD family protein [Bacteroidota bacterium]MBS1672308.1 RDD family protein [Bacteroidota bacterium]